MNEGGLVSALQGSLKPSVASCFQAAKLVVTRRFSRKIDVQLSTFVEVRFLFGGGGGVGVFFKGVSGVCSWSRETEEDFFRSGVLRFGVEVYWKSICNIGGFGCIGLLESLEYQVVQVVAH